MTQRLNYQQWAEQVNRIAGFEQAPVDEEETQWWDEAQYAYQSGITPEAFESGCIAYHWGQSRPEPGTEQYRLWHEAQGNKW